MRDSTVEPEDAKPDDKLDGMAQRDPAQSNYTANSNFLHPRPLCLIYIHSNGPGKFQVGGQAIGHPLDGDGFISSISVQGGKAFYRSDFVQTPECVTWAGRDRVLGSWQGYGGAWFPLSAPEPMHAHILNAIGRMTSP